MSNVLWIFPACILGGVFVDWAGRYIGDALDWLWYGKEEKVKYKRKRKRR